MSCIPCQWAGNVALALDKFCNAIIGGDPNETMSARFDRARVAGAWVGKVMCAFLNLFQKNHCEYAADNGRLSIGVEIFDLNTGRLHALPVAEVVVTNDLRED